MACTSHNRHDPSQVCSSCRSLLSLRVRCDVVQDTRASTAALRRCQDARGPGQGNEADKCTVLERRRGLPQLETSEHSGSMSSVYSSKRNLPYTAMRARAHGTLLVIQPYRGALHSGDPLTVDLDRGALACALVTVTATAVPSTFTCHTCLRNGPAKRASVLPEHSRPVRASSRILSRWELGSTARSCLDLSSDLFSNAWLDMQSTLRS